MRSEEHLGVGKRSLRAGGSVTGARKGWAGLPGILEMGSKQYGGFGIFKRDLSKFRRHNVVQEAFRGSATVHLLFARMRFVLVCSDCFHKLQ